MEPQAQTAPERQHGDVNTYAAGCRCEPCQAAWRTYMTKRRRRLGVQPRAARQPRPARKTLAAYYPGKTVQRSLSLTPLGASLLDGVKLRTGRSDGDVFEHYLRTHPELTFEPTTTASSTE